MGTKDCHICVPVLRRYDLLAKLIDSCQSSSVLPIKYWVIDNGLNPREVIKAVNGHYIDLHLECPDQPMGLAESWNWFIRHVPEERFIVNDDIEFAHDSIERMVAAQAAFVSCTYGFSCFIIRDECVQKVGMFDESISPGYAYFEDMDYLRRMRLASVEDDVVDCGVIHAQSATPRRYSSEEMESHHIRFNLAQENYMRKWEMDPSWEQLRTIGGAGVNQ